MQSRSIDIDMCNCVWIRVDGLSRTIYVIRVFLFLISPREPSCPSMTLFTNYIYYDPSLTYTSSLKTWSFQDNCSNCLCGITFLPTWFPCLVLLFSTCCIVRDGNTVVLQEYLHCCYCYAIVFNYWLLKALFARPIPIYLFASIFPSNVIALPTYCNHIIP